MFRNVLLMALLGVGYGSIFEQSLKFSPLRKGIHRFAMDAAKQAKKFESPTRFDSDVDGKQGDLLEKLRAALLLKGQPVNGKSLLSLFGLRPPSPTPSQDRGKTNGVTLQSFTFANCSAKAVDKTIFSVQQLTIQPDPLVMPGAVNFTFDINIVRTITKLSVDLDFRKRVGSVYIKIPCIGEFGSCTYPVCDMLEQVSSCPEKLQRDKIPCQCPFQKGVYKEPGFAPVIQGAVFPPGDYKATANLTSLQDGEMKFAGCYEVMFTIG